MFTLISKRTACKGASEERCYAGTDRKGEQDMNIWRWQILRWMKKAGRTGGMVIMAKKSKFEMVKNFKTMDSGRKRERVSSKGMDQPGEFQKRLPGEDHDEQGGLKMMKDGICTVEL